MRGDPSIQFLGQYLKHPVMTCLHRQAQASSIEIEAVNRTVKLDTAPKPLGVLLVIRRTRVSKSRQDRLHLLPCSPPQLRDGHCAVVLNDIARQLTGRIDAQLDADAVFIIEQFHRVRVRRKLRVKGPKFHG